ncbi:MAG: EVE domain-containing protein [Pseudolysinimonas sp.]|uniref:EVE domain-containing protein n=1 Tax=Pseudolysinimonas sp. TaxID=2680009 RepID=UPI0032671286
MTYWLAVVHRDHVRRGVDQGIVQVNHGSKAGVAKMSPGDGLVYYSPKDAYPEGAPLRAFTAIGLIADGDPWQAAPMMMRGDGEVRPWRRRVEYLEGVAEVPIQPLLPVLELTRDTPNWGWLMRRGLLELSAADFAVIATEMGADTLIP